MWLVQWEALINGCLLLLFNSLRPHKQQHGPPSSAVREMNLLLATGKKWSSAGEIKSQLYLIIYLHSLFLPSSFSLLFPPLCCPLPADSWGEESLRSLNKIPELPETDASQHFVTHMSGAEFLRISREEQDGFHCLLLHKCCWNEERWFTTTNGCDFMRQSGQKYGTTWLIQLAYS